MWLLILFFTRTFLYISFTIPLVELISLHTSILFPRVELEGRGLRFNSGTSKICNWPNIFLCTKRWQNHFVLLANSNHSHITIVLRAFINWKIPTVSRFSFKPFFFGVIQRNTFMSVIKRQQVARSPPRRKCGEPGGTSAGKGPALNLKILCVCRRPTSMPSSRKGRQTVSSFDRRYY